MTMGAAKERHIALVGFMGAGKSTVGRLLAVRTGLPFVDTDRLIEEYAGRAIPEIFAQEGEDAFRGYESDALRQVLARSRSVIATGGGILLREENRKLLAAGAVTVWLRIEFAELRNRLLGSTDRPLLEDDPDLQRAETLYNSRIHLYRQADIWVDAAKPPQQVVDAIVDALDRNGVRKADGEYVSG